MHKNQYRDSVKMKKQRNVFQAKKQDKTPETDLNEMEISDFPDKEFKIMVIKVLIKFRRRMNDHSENFHKEIENIRKFQNWKSQS